jgi:hypothetical protein
MMPTPKTVPEEGKWIKTIVELPPKNTVVMTKIDYGHGVSNEQELKLVNTLWFFPDGSMYVYYTPTHWKPTKTL